MIRKTIFAVATVAAIGAAAGSVNAQPRSRAARPGPVDFAQGANGVRPPR